MKVFAENLNGERVAACDDDGMVFVDVDDRDIGFDLEFGGLFGFGFEDEHEVIVYTRAEGYTLKVHARFKLQVVAEGVDGGFGEVTFFDCPHPALSRGERGKNVADFAIFGEMELDVVAVVPLIR